MVEVLFLAYFQENRSKTEKILIGAEPYALIRHT
ncbi:hypothetical protein FHS90_000250 [Rufibacter quisquiliarum]|uniref:Uncharacterized protein n=1 Tax=Rufibacter quisquiliarum TaxID=1549639 RepID=A0A839GDE9_9BACT|nr:hypothetical protein [Rufibacter quisquiliarum]